MRLSISVLLSEEETIVVLSLSMVTLTACPSISRVTVSRLKPTSSEIISPPVSTAISCKTAFRRSPKLGALMATTFNTPLALLTTKVARASPSTFSAIINKALPARATVSSTGTISAIVLIFLSVIRI